MFNLRNCLVKAVVNEGVLPSAVFHRVKRVLTYFRERGPEVSSVHFGDVEVVSAFGRD